MDRDEFWSTDDDEAVLAEYLAQHSFSVAFTDEQMVVQFGDPDRLPEPEDVGPVEALCAVCDQPLKLIPEVGWRHLTGFRERGGCTTPWPRAA